MPRESRDAARPARGDEAVTIAPGAVGSEIDSQGDSLPRRLRVTRRSAGPALGDVPRGGPALLHTRRPGHPANIGRPGRCGHTSFVSFPAGRGGEPNATALPSPGPAEATRCQVASLTLIRTRPERSEPASPLSWSRVCRRRGAPDSRERDLAAWSPDRRDSLKRRRISRTLAGGGLTRKAAPGFGSNHAGQDRSNVTRLEVAWTPLASVKVNVPKKGGRNGPHEEIGPNAACATSEPEASRGGRRMLTGSTS